MLEYMKEETNKTMTENGAVTLETTGSDCLDLFATIGALRRESDDEIIRRFTRAYTEDADMAMKLLFYARDVRDGLGERRIFRVIIPAREYKVKLCGRRFCRDSIIKRHLPILI